MTEEIIQKKQYWVEFISFSKKHCNYTDEDLAEHIVKMVEKAINYTRCSAQLKDKKTITINKWTEDNGYKHSFTDCYIKGDDWFTGKQMWQKYNEAMKSL
jgi:hypothetical protein|tara:strand:- start:978 stop:1277 length:300 start_codon:yes stop_codon:yes gene_type:complete